MKTLTYEQLVIDLIEVANTIEVLGYEFNEAEVLQQMDPIAFRERVLSFADANDITII
jgi:hypothetical protein